MDIYDDNPTVQRPAQEDATQLAPKPLKNGPKKLNDGKGRKALIAVLIVLLLGGMGTGAYFLFFQKDSHSVYEDDEDDDEEDEEEDEDSSQTRNSRNSRNSRDSRNTSPSSDSSNPSNSSGAGTYTIDENDLNEPVAPPPPAPDEPRQLVLQGDADGYPLTLTLTIDDDKVTGQYKNETYGTLMNVSGTYSNDVFYLTGRADNTTYTFRIVPEGHIYTGTFNSANGRSLELHLTVNR